MGNLSALGNTVVQTTPVGVIEAFAGVNAPAGWLFCDGSAISRIQYPELFSALGTTYGSGDGSTTFNIPDLRGRMPFGKGTHSDVATLGNNEGASLANRRPKHQHTVYFNDPGHAHNPMSGSNQRLRGINVNSVIGNPNGYNVYSADASRNTAYGITDTDSTGTNTTGLNIKVNPENASSSTSPSDAPPYLVVNYIIKAVADLPRGGWFYQNQPSVVTQLPSNPQIGEEVHHLVNNSYFDKKYNGSTWVNINEQPSVEIVAGAGQTGFVVDTWTKLTFPSATVTNNFGFTISNGIITIPSNLGGLYHVSGQCQWDANYSGIRLLSFAESGNYNGTVLSGPTVPSASYMRTPVSGLIRLTGGQSYCLWGINSGSGGTRDLIITFLTQRFNIARVSS